MAVGIMLLLFVVISGLAFCVLLRRHNKHQKLVCDLNSIGILYMYVFKLVDFTDNVRSLKDFGCFMLIRYSSTRNSIIFNNYCLHNKPYLIQPADVILYLNKVIPQC